MGNVLSLESVKAVQKIDRTQTPFYLHYPVSFYSDKNNNKHNNVKSLISTSRLTPGLWLNTLKCRTARFIGCGGRLALLLSEYIETLL